MLVAILIGCVTGILAAEVSIGLVTHRAFKAQVKKVERAILRFFSSTEDEERQRWILQISLSMLAAALWFLGGVALLGVAFIWLPDWFDWSPEREDAFLLTATLTSLIYVWWRLQGRKFHLQPASSQSSVEYGTLAFANYGLIARLLHWVALEPTLVSKTSFDIEKLIYGPTLRKRTQSTSNNAGPVFVCGLARSGTTILLEILNKTGEFASPTYRDMPFVLAPNLWKKVSHSSQTTPSASMRAHGDGILISPDSPESFEEVFWRSVCGSIDTEGYSLVDPDDETLQDFKIYQELFILSNENASGGNAKKRYLSKNNNNLLRIPSLLKDPTAKILLVVRDPASTAWSLYQQHQRFSQLQANDDFARAYMRWLGHHEFGLGHRPLTFAARDLRGISPETPDYWLTYWFGVHSNLLKRVAHERIAIVFSERIQKNPVKELERLSSFLLINKSKLDELAYLVKSNRDGSPNHSLIFNPEILKLCEDTYRTLHSESKYKDEK